MESIDTRTSAEQGWIAGEDKRDHISAVHEFPQGFRWVWRHPFASRSLRIEEVVDHMLSLVSVAEFQIRRV